MVEIRREELGEILRWTNGRFYTVSFVKKDGTLRTMNTRTGVHIDLKGGENLAVKYHSNLKVAYDIKKHAYRMINLDTIFQIKYNHKTYKVVPDAGYEVHTQDRGY